MALSRYDIVELVKELREYKLVQTTKTSIVKDNSRLDDPYVGHETVVEYTIEKKK